MQQEKMPLAIKSSPLASAAIVFENFELSEMLSPLNASQRTCVLRDRVKEGSTQSKITEFSRKNIVQLAHSCITRERR